MSYPRQELSRVLAGIVIVASLVTIAVQALNIGGWVVPRGPGPYLFGVTWLIAYSGLMFYRLITAPIMSGEPG